MSLVYAHAAHAGLRLNYDVREMEIRTSTPPKPATNVIKSRWMER